MKKSNATTRDAGFRRMTRALSVTAAAVAAASGLALAPPASAAPSNCSGWGTGLYAHALCSGGYTGYYQVYTTCTNAFWPFNAVFQEGPWYPAGSGRVSETRCPILFDAKNTGVGLRR